jgi:hypothetical protein
LADRPLSLAPVHDGSDLLFEKNHRICVEITSLDLAEGVCGETSVEYIPYHICSSKTVVHKVHHNAEYPSHLLVPVNQARELRQPPVPSRSSSRISAAMRAATPATAVHLSVGPSSHWVAHRLPESDDLVRPELQHFG